MRRGWSLTIQIAVMGAVLSVIAMTAFLLATERSTSDRLIEQIDQDLGTQAREWQRTMRASPPTDGTALAARARTWLNRQREHPASQVQIISIVGGRTLSNQSDLVARSAATQADPPSGIDDPWLLATATGLSTATVDGHEHIRVLTVPIQWEGRLIGTLRVADSLVVVDRARDSLRLDLLRVGLPIVVVSAALTGALAAALLRPLRRVSAAASAVQGGDLSARTRRQRCCAGRGAPRGPRLGRHAQSTAGHRGTRTPVHLRCLPRVAHAVGGGPGPGRVAAGPVGSCGGPRGTDSADPTHRRSHRSGGRPAHVGIGR